MGAVDLDYAKLAQDLKVPKTAGFAAAGSWNAKE